VDALDFRSLLLGHRQPVMDSDPLEHEHALPVEHLANRLDLVPLWIDFDLTRLQRACEGAGQSTPGGCDHVVERRGVRREGLRIDAVMLRDLRVHAEGDRLTLRRQVGKSLGTAKALDAHPGDVSGICHVSPSRLPS
jgi:hypothetical protein